MMDRWRGLCRATIAMVKLGPALAVHVMSAGGSCLHCVPITRRTQRLRLLVRSEPPKACLAAFVVAAHQRLAAAAGPVGAPPCRLPGWAKLMTEPGLMLDWLDATSTVKSIRHSTRASTAWTRLIARCNDLSRSDLRSNMQHVSYTCLRLARVRLDIVAMMVWRAFWSSRMGSAAFDDIHLYIYCDASPQKGSEYFASTLDVYDRRQGTWARWLLPCVVLDPTLMDAFGKTLALLWQVFLIAGPSFEAVRAFCNKVRSLTTDLGVERLVVQQPDWLPDFWQLLAPRLPRPPADQSWLWPNAVSIPGWKHAWDGLLQKGLCTLPWFPLWLTRLKAICGFFRIEGNRVTAARSLRAVGFGALSEIVKSFSFPSFADWRWGTLHAVMKELHSCLGSLADHFDPRPFARGRDQVGLAAVIAALACDAWHKQFAFVWFFTCWLVGLMGWGTGCACHEADLMRGAGVEINCPRKGRRLREAPAHVFGELDRVLQESTAWGDEVWGLGMEALIQLQGCIRGTVHLARRKFEWIARVPYLFSRLGAPGVAAEALRQWASCPREDHHRVTRCIVDEHWEAINNIAPGGTGASHALQAVMDSLAGVPLDDSIAEGPMPDCSASHGILEDHAGHG